MKKLVLITIVFMMVAAVYATSGLQVTNPKAGETIYRWTTKDYMIKWKKSGEVGKFVKIRLFDKTGTNKIYKIVDKVPEKNEQFPWPKNMIKNTDIGDYVIKVTFTTDNFYYDFSGVFHIRDKPGLTMKMPKIYKKPAISVADIKGTVQITSPAANGSYEINKPMTISWNKNLGANSKVNIYLCTETNAQGEKIFPETTNSGNVQWIPPIDKVSWPGDKPYIKISTPNNFYSGKSGLFNIVPPQVNVPPAAKNKVIARTPAVSNEKTSSFSDSGEPDCLSVGMYLPGRNPKAKEIKVGHWKRKSKGVKCDWVSREYYFTSKLDFDISPAASKEIVRAELLITLGELQLQYPHGEETGTNAYCNSSCRVFAGNTFLKSFSVFEEGKTVKINLLNSIKNWAAMNLSTPYSITFKGPNDNVPINDSVCLKYYSGPILFVEYKE